MDNDELHDKVTILFIFRMFFSHELHELPDQFRHHEIERGRNECDYDCRDEITKIGENKIQK